LVQENFYIQKLKIYSPFGWTSRLPLWSGWIFAEFQCSDQYLELGKMVGSMETLETNGGRSYTNSNLVSTFYIDSDSALIEDFAYSAVSNVTDVTSQGIALYYAVRDSIRYDPYNIDCTPVGFKASKCIEHKRGFCITKAALLAACARVIKIPSRVGFGDVRNHLATPRLIALMGTDEFVFHGFAELYLNGQWVKATPAFNLTLCERFGVLPLEFDGMTDSLFHPFDAAGQRHMEYIRQRGSFDDVPFEDIMAAFKETYPVAFARGFKLPDADFERDAGKI